MPAPLRSARLAVYIIFAVNGVLIATWVPHIPSVQLRLGLSEGILGLALLCMAIGAITAMPAAGYLTARFGSRSVTTVAALSCSLAVTLPVIAPSLPLLMLGLFMFGASSGAMDVAMNAQAVAVEQAYRRAIMSSFHALFSVGAFIGASVSWVVITLGVTPAGHALGVSSVMVVVVLFMAKKLLADKPEESAGPKFALPRGPLLGLGALAFFGLLGEGAMGDWSAVYLRNVLGTDAGLAAAGFAAFSLTMTIGRFTGDALVTRFGPRALMRASGVVAAVGLALGLFIASPTTAIIGFGCMGLGVANIVPLLFSAAGRVPGLHPGTAIAAVTTAGYTGFLVGPPLIGFTAELVTLRGALVLVVVFMGVIALYAGLVYRQQDMVVADV